LMLKLPEHFVLYHAAERRASRQQGRLPAGATIA